MVQEVIHFYKKLLDDDIGGVAAQLAYYLLLSFFPFLIALVSLLSFLPIGPEQLLAELSKVFPDSAYELIAQNMGLFSSRSGGLLSISFISALWVASKGANATARSLNKAYHTNGTRPFWKNYIVSFIITLSLVVFIILSLAFFLFSDYFLSAYSLSKQVVYLLSQLRMLVMFVALVSGMALLYRLVPNRALSLRQVISGALVSAVLWVVSTVGFEIYVDNFRNFSNIYGTLGGVIVLLLWLYLISFAMLLGNEINSYLVQNNKIELKRKKTKAQKR